MTIRALEVAFVFEASFVGVVIRESKGTWDYLSSVVVVVVTSERRSASERLARVVSEFCCHRNNVEVLFGCLAFQS